MHWYFPTWSGDFRLEPIEDQQDKCLLSIERPTATEKRVLAAFLTAAETKGWVMAAVAGKRLTKRTKRTIELTCTVAEAAPLLVAPMFGEAGTWTGIRVGGKVELVEGLPPAATKEAEAAVTLRKPRRGCPKPEATVRRASEVLKTFCTQRQWTDWVRLGFLRARGNHTGQLYTVFHRNEAARRRIPRLLTDHQGYPMCVYDQSLPPEEEALAIKFAVEHRERWLLSEPGVFLP